MPRWQMFLRLVQRSLRAYPGRLWSSMIALAAGATLASVFLSLYLDIPRKMTAEFRALGPNLMMVPAQTAETLPAGLKDRVAAQWPGISSLPWLYAIGQVHGEDVVLSGTELNHIARLHPTWLGLPAFAPGSADDGKSESSNPRLLAGEKAAAHFGWKPGDAVTFAYLGKEMTLPLAGIISTGGSEDSHLLVPLDVLQNLTGQPGAASVIELAVPGSAEQVHTVLAALQEQMLEAEVRPLRAVVESEAQVLMKVRGLMLGLAGIVLLIVILSVLNTVKGLLLDRQKDIGVMKALGASDGSVMALFVSEMGALALFAGFVGYAAGLGLAELVAAHVFHSGVALRGDVFVAVVTITALLAVIGAAFPVRGVRRLDPAVILRGE